MVDNNKKKTVAVRIDDSSTAGIECSDGMIEILSPHYNIIKFTPRDVSQQLFSHVDLIVIPGGVGDADDYWRYFPRKAGNVIADYIASGGHYLGVCIGAYWADQKYIDLMDHQIRVVQYIRQPTADIRRSYNTVAKVTWEGGERHDVYFRDGCTFIAGDDDSVRYHTIATYANGQPFAIGQNNIVLIGGCLDSQLSWYQATPRLLPHWHGGVQHNLLLTVIERLLTGKYAI